MAEIILLCRFLKEDGQGALDASFLETAQAQVWSVLEQGSESGIWSFPEEIQDILRQIINEYDRLLFHSPVASLVQANQRLLALATKSAFCVR